MKEIVFSEGKKELKKEMLELCKNNQQLADFIKQTFLGNPKKEIVAYDQSSWEWDFEIGEFSSLFYIKNEDMVEVDEDLPIEERGWQQNTLEETFEEYALYDDELEKATLDNGKVLVLLDQDDYLEFLILDLKKVVGGWAIL
jgi:hypothetical protein